MAIKVVKAIKDKRQKTKDKRQKTPAFVKTSADRQGRKVVKL